MIGIFLSIVTLFGILLLLKAALPMGIGRKICAICFAVGGTWLGLLILRSLGRDIDTTVLGLLLGMSVTGIYSVAEHKVSSEMRLFRLPFLISLLAGAGLLLGFLEVASMVFLVALWVFFTLLYMFRHSAKIQALATRMVACCREW